MSDSDDSSGLKAELEKIKQSLQGGDDEPDMVEASGRQPSQEDNKPDMVEAAGRQQEEGESSEGEMIEAQGRQPEPPGEGDQENLEAAGRQPGTEESAGETASSSTPGDRINEGNTYIVEITDIASKGDGMLSYRGKTIIVPETEIDEVVEIRITTNSRNFAFGEVVERDVDGEPINSEG